MARRQRVITGSGDERPNVDIFLHINAKLHPARRHAPPFPTLAQGRWRTADQHRRDVPATADRDIGSAALQAHRAVGRSPSTFREDNQIAAAAERRNAIVQHADAGIVADITGRAHRSMGERVVPQPALDDAIGALDEGHQKNRIDQCRMIGQDQQTIALQPLESGDAVAQHTESTHQADKAAKRDPNHRPRQPDAQPALPNQ